MSISRGCTVLTLFTTTHLQNSKTVVIWEHVTQNYKNFMEYTMCTYKKNFKLFNLIFTILYAKSHKQTHFEPQSGVSSIEIASGIYCACILKPSVINRIMQISHWRAILGRTLSCLYQLKRQASDVVSQPQQLWVSCSLC